MLQAALSYAARGLQVFALAARSKVAPRGSHAFKDATTDPVAIRAMWRENANYNVGIRTGAGSGIMAIDVDAKPGQVDGATFGDLVRHLGELPITVECRSSAGSFHLYFKHPGVAIKSVPSGLGLHVDVFGDTGHLVAPPSIHPSGAPYGWAPGRAFGDVEIAELPPAWLEYLLARQAEPERSAPREPPPPRAAAANGHTNGATYAHDAYKEAYLRPQWKTRSMPCTPRRRAKRPAQPCGV
jgi:hypothetical protein